MSAIFVDNPQGIERFGDPGRPMASWPVRSDLSHLPGKSGPVAGLTNLLGWRRRGVAHLVDQTRRYGPVYRHVMGSLPVVFVADPDALGRIGRNEERSWSSALAWRMFFDGIEPEKDTFDALTGLDFEFHRDARRLVQPAFASTAIAAYLDSTIDVYEKAIQEWITRGRVAFKSDVRRVFANVSGRIFLGLKDDEQAEELDRTLADWWRAPLAMARKPYLSRNWRLASNADLFLREKLRPLVSERRAAPGADLFSRMCQVGRDQVAWLDDDSLVRMFMSVLSAAFDTTSLGTISMAYLLCKYPDWQEALRREARSIRGARLAYEELGVLEQTEWVWKETLRLFPVALGLPRRALRDTTVVGHRIPSGTFVMAMIAPLMQDPQWWTDPQAFDPARFAPGRAEDRRHRSIFLPFGVGAHACIGAQLATAQVKAFWQALLSKCRIRLARDYTARHQLRPLGCVSGDVEIVVEPL